MDLVVDRFKALIFPIGVVHAFDHEIHIRANSMR